MKKLFKSYLIIWVILLALFNTVAFAIPGWGGQGKYTGSFWVGYVFITLAFAGQLFCAWHMTKKCSSGKTVFYHLPLLTISRAGLILTCVFGGLSMLISPLPYWVGVILCAIVLAFTAVAVVKADAAADLVSAVDEKTKANTFFIKSLTADAESLLARAGSEELRAACKKVYEAARYSDPVSHSALAALEREITLKLAALSDAVKAADAPAASGLADELAVLLRERNNKCKLLK